MKKAIERLKEEVSQPTCKLMQKVCAYISIDDAQKIIEFYESTIKESGLSEDEFQNGGYTDAELTCKSGCMGPCGQCKDESVENGIKATPNPDSLAALIIEKDVLARRLHEIYSKIGEINDGVIEDNPLSFDKYTEPNWSEIPKGFDWVSIDGTGGEYAYQSEPHPINHINLWNSRLSSVFTGRKFDMSNINWKDTLLKRPK